MNMKTKKEKITDWIVEGLTKIGDLHEHLNMTNIILGTLLYVELVINLFLIMN